MAGFYEALEQERRKAQQYQAAQRQAQAAQQYAATKSEVDNKYNGGLGGFLGGIIGGIGKGISDVGNGVIDMLGSGVASARDLGSLIATGQLGDEEEKWLKYRRGTDDIKDARLKTAGQALNAATTLATTAVPGLGAGSTAAKALGGMAANTAAGAIGGVADEFQQQGKDARLDSIANRAISGAAAGLATGGLNKKIGNATGNISSKLLNNKLATSTLGRGALSGAVGGATGAGTSAALGGGDVAQAALQGGLSGAVSGGVQAGLMSGANRLGQNLMGRFNNRRQTQTQVQPQAQTEQVSTVDTTPTRKQQQFELIQQKNPMTDDYHTGIRKVEDIMTFKEALNSPDAGDEYYVYPDWTKSNAAEAANNGKVTVYSSYPIEEGVFVSPSKMMAQDYAGGGQVYSKEIPLDDVAWINGDEGNYAPVKVTKETKLDIPDYTTPKDWSGKEIKLDKKGLIGGIGDKLVNASKSIKDQDVYNALYSKTADKVIANNSIERLRDLGFEPKDYGDAAKVSTAVNKFLDDVVAGSNAKYADAGFIDRLGEIKNRATLGTTAVEKKFNTEVGSLISRLEKGAAPGEYDVKTLLDESRYFKKLAATEYKNGIDVNGGDKGNYRKDLGEAFSEVANDLRNMADSGMGGLGDNYTKSQLTQMLQKLKAPQQAIDYLTNFKDLPEAINKTALLEDGRQMNKELRTTKVRRNATAGDSGKLLNRIANKSGLTEVTNLVAEPVGKASGKVLETIGKGLQRLDGAVNSGVALDGTPTQPLSQDAQFLLGNFIGRTEGQNASGNMVQNARRAEDYQNLEDMFANMQAENAQSEALGLNQAAATQSPILAQMTEIEGAMNRAMAAGDIKAYSQLADMYKDAYNVYQMQTKMADAGSNGSEMSTAEKNQIAKLQSAGTALDQLESLYQKAGGGQGVIGGNIANFLGGLGLNSDVNTYNQLAQGLINQIGAAIGKTDSLNTEGEVQRALSLVPKITDDNQTAMNKLATLRQLLQQNTNSYNQLYGA